MFTTKNNKFFTIISFFFIFTLLSFLIFKYFKVELMFKQKNNKEIESDQGMKEIYTMIYNNIYKIYLNENLNLLRDYFYQAFNEYNQINFKIIYSRVHNYSILTKLKRVNQTNYDYIYVEILPVIRLRKINNSIIQEEAKVYSDLLYNSIYLIDKKLKKELNLKELIKIIIFDYNKVAIEK